MRLLWTGTDSLMLVDYSKQRLRKRVYWWLFRRFIRLAEFFIQGHSTISDNLNDNLKRFGVKKPIEHIDSPLKHTKKYPRVPHDKFTILYYEPEDKYNNMKFQRWLYGYDIYEYTRRHFGSAVRWAIVDGTYDMSKIYPIVDFYLRPNRHDGPSRIRMECDIQEIPYYWTQRDPNPTAAVAAIEGEYRKFKYRHD